MTNTSYDKDKFQKIEYLIGYFDRQVLAPYQNEPHKYVIKTDYFFGELRTAEPYYLELEDSGKSDQRVNVRFGYRTLNDGSLAVVAWLPDLIEKSKAHIDKWAAFKLQDPEWMSGFDERFNNWVRRHMEGSWDIDNGPSFYIEKAVNVINGLATELVGIPLYKYQLPPSGINYPTAENTHRYQDAHKDLYGYLIDGLDKQCISRLGAQINKDINLDSDRTLKALYKLLPNLKTSSNFKPAMDLVSKQRRLASHGVRPPSESFMAFSRFKEDLSMCQLAVQELLITLEAEMGLSGEQAYKRNKAKEWIPKITRPARQNYSIVQASSMEGKTVEKVEYGFREEIEGVHQSEVLIIYFTDGSIVGIEAGSNAGNLADDNNDLKPEDFHVDFMLHWVPKLLSKNESSQED